jgi:branched-chain amino acid transport system substrate-binding protein
MRSPQRVLFRLLLVPAVTLGLCHCTKTDPIPLGLVAGLSGSGADLGGPARDGVLLAIEEVNAQGGVHGRPIELLIRDDRQDPRIGAQAVRELIDEKVEAIIGPVTSSIAVATVELANQSKTLMFGLTITTNQLTGLDDYFLRGLAPTSHHVAAMAEYIYRKRAINSFSAIVETANHAYTQSWVTDFERHFSALGGRRIKQLSFTSGQSELLPILAREIVADQPGIILFVTNAVDAAMLAKLVRSLDPEVPLGTSEWSGTERFVELGGKYVENTIVPQYIDRMNQDSRYLDFEQRYFSRFHHAPGFAGIVGYNVTQALLRGLSEKSHEQHLKDVLIGIGSFDSIQGPMILDQFGDAQNRTYITEVRNGDYFPQDMR